MKQENNIGGFRLRNGSLVPLQRQLVQEYPLRLVVNDRELATLIASPHQLNFLVAGFLRLQGFIHCRDDLLSLGICSDYGLARVRIRAELPQTLRPVLTSGCGSGVSFDLPQGLAEQKGHLRFPVQAILGLMEELTKHAESYRCHGGIHSAAVGDGLGVRLFAEDLGRHNTLDRIAGEALLRDIDLAGQMLVTSGRVSTEMVAKAAGLGIALIASRTSPTDLAVRLCREAGITLIGYLRGKTFEVYTHPERIDLARPQAVRPEVTGVILAGGESPRMGSDKALLPHRGGRFIETIYRQLSEIFCEVLVVTNHPELYPFLPCRKVPDLIACGGLLAGIHSALQHSRTEHVFVVGCDMPQLSPALIREISQRDPQWDVVIPESRRGPEPLHARYSRRCLGPIEQALGEGRKKILSFFEQVKVKRVDYDEVTRITPGAASFENINTPQDYFDLREQEQTKTASPGRPSAGSGRSEP